MHMLEGGLEVTGAVEGDAVSAGHLTAVLADCSCVAV